MLSLLQSFFKAEALVAFLAEFPYEALRPELTISARICAGFTVVKAFPAVKNPVLPHGASSIEKAILIRWRSGLKPSWPFIPALPGGAFWLFHVTYKHLLAGNVGIAIRVVCRHFMTLLGFRFPCRCPLFLLLITRLTDLFLKFNESGLIYGGGTSKRRSTGH